jgi:hypothetical protein
MRGAEFQQTTLIVLQSITGAFHLDHSITLLPGPELHQIRKSGTVLWNIPHDPFKPKAQMRGRKTPQRPVQELRAQSPPGDKGRLVFFVWPGRSCSCTRPATASQRRDFDSPHGLQPLPLPWVQSPAGIRRASPKRLSRRPQFPDRLSSVCRLSLDSLRGPFAVRVVVTGPLGSA